MVPHKLGYRHLQLEMRVNRRISILRGPACQTTLHQTLQSYSYTDVYISYLPGYVRAAVWKSTSSLRRKKTWVGTTGAVQNCPERESESLGEDIFSHFFEDGIFVLVSSFSFPDLSQVNRPVLQHLWCAEAFRACASNAHANAHAQSDSEQRHRLFFPSLKHKKDHVSAKRAQSFFKKTRSAGISGACLVDDDLAEAVMGPAIHRTAPPQRTDCFSLEKRKRLH